MTKANKLTTAILIAIAVVAIAIAAVAKDQMTVNAVIADDLSILGEYDFSKCDPEIYRKMLQQTRSQAAAAAVALAARERILDCPEAADFRAIATRGVDAFYARKIPWYRPSALFESAVSTIKREPSYTTRLEERVAKAAQERKP